MEQGKGINEYLEQQINTNKVGQLSFIVVEQSLGALFPLCNE